MARRREPPKRFRSRPLLEVLVAHDVDFVVVGGLAGTVHGSAYPTFDLDVAYERSPENVERLATALHELGARLRGAPEDVPFQLDARTLRAGANFTFTTRHGSLDILGDAAGAPRYETLKRASDTTRLDGISVRVASLDHLIAMKEAAGRPKDRLMATEYRVLADELRAPQTS